MKEIINKELLSLVVAEKVTNYGVENNGLWYTIPKVFGHKILNLDTLGRLCKEWCLKQDYELMSGIIKKECVCLIYTIKANRWDDVTTKKLAGTEIEAVIKATEWVAKEKGIKDEH